MVHFFYRGFQWFMGHKYCIGPLWPCRVGLSSVFTTQQAGNQRGRFRALGPWPMARGLVIVRYFFCLILGAINVELPL